jgi:hypothetical protein
MRDDMDWDRINEIRRMPDQSMQDMLARTAAVKDAIKAILQQDVVKVPLDTDMLTHLLSMRNTCYFRFHPEMNWHSLTESEWDQICGL